MPFCNRDNAAYSAGNFRSSRLDDDAWRQELHRIESSRAFAASRRMRALLAFLINETLEGRQDRLKEFTIGTAVLGRGSDFDARIDSTVRNEAWRLRSRLNQYYRGEGAGNPVRIEFAPRSFIPNLRCVDPAPGPTSVPPKCADVNDCGDEPLRLAVLPFLVRDAELRRSDFGVAVAQELCLLLGTHSKLRVFTPLQDGSDIFRLQDRRLSTWAAQSGVRSLLRGTLQRDRNLIRVMAQVVEINNGTQIWAHGATLRCRKELNLQCGIASELARALLLSSIELARAFGLRDTATSLTHPSTPMTQCVSTAASP